MKVNKLEHTHTSLTEKLHIPHIVTMYNTALTYQWRVFVVNVTRYTRKSLHIAKKCIWWRHSSLTKLLDIGICHLDSSAPNKKFT